MLFSQDRAQLRRYFCDVWQKRSGPQTLEPLERIIVDTIDRHPEYQQLIEDPDRAIDQDYLPEGGQTNPFLHMGMHIALQEQIHSDRPAGITAVYATLYRQSGDEHMALHRMMDCLGETLWEAQRQGTPPDEHRYLDRLRRLVGQEHDR